MRQPRGIRCPRKSVFLKEEKPLTGSFLIFVFNFATGEGGLRVLRAGMMRPNRGFILLLLNGTACLVRKECLQPLQTLSNILFLRRHRARHKLPVLSPNVHVSAPLPALLMLFKAL